MTLSRGTSSNAETVVIAAIENGAPPLAQAREMIDAFHWMLRQKPFRSNAISSTMKDNARCQPKPTN
jgi:hypothetical protein